MNHTPHPTDYLVARLRIHFSSYTSSFSETSIIKDVPMSLRNHPTIKKFEQAGGTVRCNGQTFTVYPYGR